MISITGTQIVIGVLIAFAGWVVSHFFRHYFSWLSRKAELKQQLEAETIKNTAAAAATAERNKHEINLLEKKQTHEMEILKYKQELLERK